jgi:hypothetical protein
MVKLNPTEQPLLDAFATPLAGASAGETTFAFLANPFADRICRTNLNVICVFSHFAVWAG